tara:strand:+ start:299 stop:508 length:210 start_codon:yes stop_codon:yes gene_type:complete
MEEKKKKRIQEGVELFNGFKVKVHDKKQSDFDSSEVFYGCDFGDEPSKLVKTTIAIKDGKIYVLNVEEF